MPDTTPALPPDDDDDDDDGRLREHIATATPSLYTISLGPVPSNSVYKILCPSGRRAILPHSCDQRYGRDEYASDVSDSDVECEVIVKRVGCLLDKTKK